MLCLDLGVVLAPLQRVFLKQGIPFQESMRPVDLCRWVCSHAYIIADSSVRLEADAGVRRREREE